MDTPQKPAEALPPVAILAGGLGTRLRSVVDGQPKALADVGEGPFLELQLRHLAAAGFSQVVLCTGYLHDQIEGHFGDGRRLGLSLGYSVETNPLGTAGALKQAGDRLGGTFVAMNGDSFVDVDITAVVAHHRRRVAGDEAYVATVVLTEVPDAAGYGLVVVDDQVDDRADIVSFAEKSASGGPGLVNAGVYVLEPGALSKVPPGQKQSLEREVFPQLIASGRRLGGFVSAGYFVDIGTPEGYYHFRDYLEESRG